MKSNYPDKCFGLRGRMFLVFLVATLFIVAVGRRNPPAVTKSLLIRNVGVGEEFLSRRANGRQEFMEWANHENPDVKSMIADICHRFGQGLFSATDPAFVKASATIADFSQEQVEIALNGLEGEIASPSLKITLQNLLFAQLARIDGRTALALAEERFKSSGPARNSARMSVFSVWAQGDPAAVWSYYQRQTHSDPEAVSDDSQMLLQAIFSAIPASAMDRALTWLGTIRGSERSLAVMGLVSDASWDANRRDAIFAATAMADEATRVEVHRDLVSRWASQDPEDAMKWASSFDGEGRANLIMATAETVMATDGRRGAEYWLTHSQPDEISQTYENIVTHWVRRDANAAGSWLGEQPQTADLDDARIRFAAMIFSRDYESAMAWAMSVTDATKRVEAMETFMDKAQVSLEEAVKVLESAGLRDEEIRATVAKITEK